MLKCRICHAVLLFYIMVRVLGTVERWVRCQWYHSGVCRTTKTGECPVAADVSGSVGKLERKWPSIGVQVSIHRCYVDGVGLGSLAHLGFLRKDARRIIINIQQIDLQCACSTRRRNTCRLGWKRECERSKNNPNFTTVAVNLSYHESKSLEPLSYCIKYLWHVYSEDVWYCQS